MTIKSGIVRLAELLASSDGDNPLKALVRKIECATSGQDVFLAVYEHALATPSDTFGYQAAAAAGLLFEAFREGDQRLTEESRERWLAELKRMIAEWKLAERNKSSGRAGGRRKAENTATVRAEALRLAEIHAPRGGWQSATQAAAAIHVELQAFARTLDRAYSLSSVIDWFREARIGRPPSGRVVAKPSR